MRYRSFLLALAALSVSAPALADNGDRGGRHWRDQMEAQDNGQNDNQREQRREDRREDRRGPDGGQRWSPDQARDGVRNGRLRPLSDIIGELQARFGGRLLGQELENEGPRTVYRIRWMTQDGRRVDLVVDAQSR